MLLNKFLLTKQNQQKTLRKQLTFNSLRKRGLLFLHYGFLVKNNLARSDELASLKPLKFTLDGLGKLESEIEGFLGSFF
jgi:hypothetical protein